MLKLKKLLFSLLTTLTMLVLLELGFRAGVRLFSPGWSAAIDNFRERWLPEYDRSLIFRPHPYTAYVNSQLGEISHVNSSGFYGPEVPVHNVINAYRVVCMGGSTTAGPRSWPYQLEQLMNERWPQRPTEVLNFGVGGWTSMESLTNFVVNGQDYKPDLVIVHHAVNDIAPMQYDRPRRDYTHYRRVLAMDEAAQGRAMLENSLKWGVDTALCKSSTLYVYTRLLLVGNVRSLYTLFGLTTYGGQDDRLTTDKQAWIFQRNLRTIGDLGDAVEAVTIYTSLPFDHRTLLPGNWAENLKRQNDRVERWAGEWGRPFVDLDALMSGRTDEFHFEDAVHVDEAGDALKARLLLEAVVARGLRTE